MVVQARLDQMLSLLPEEMGDLALFHPLPAFRSPTQAAAAAAPVGLGRLQA